mmetsp:Transcript_108784/g.307697  ORF Transcript_108784/g.307697 Transcript_108784/m.307697 type:complete len:296 (-) Transcript_108784:46-933(-)
MPPGWESLPTPVTALGQDGINDLAARLVPVAILAERDQADFHQAFVDVVHKALERQYGRGAAAKLKRVDALIRRFGYSEIRDEHIPGQGHRVVTSWIDGLSPEAPFHDAADYPWCAALAAETAAIRRELRDHLDSPDWIRAPEGTWGTMDAPEWRALGLAKGGEWIAGERFPRTRAALGSLRGMHPDEVYFARMPPHTRIGPHSDNLNFVLVAHLGLEVEEDRCTLRVGDSTRAWREGEMLVFDHTYIHAAENNSDRDRYVLVCRFWHPGCTEQERFATFLMMQVITAMQNFGGA